jgi:O-antigen/teichoic acid export membrane protein
MIKKLRKKLNGDIHLKELITGGSITFLLKIGGMGLSYLLIYYISKKTGAQGVGFFHTMLQILTVLGMILGLGINIAVLRYVGQFNNELEKDKIKDLYHNFVVVVGPLSVLVSIVLFFSSESIVQYFGKNHEYALGLKVIAFSLPFFTINQISVELIRGLKLLQISELIRSVLRPLVMTIGIFLLSFRQMTKMDIIYLLFISSVINSLVSRFAIWEKLNNLKLKRSDFSKKELIKTSLPIMVSNISAVLILSLPIFILDYYLGQQKTGEYAVAYRISILISLSLVIINTISAPTYSKLFWAGNIKELGELIKKSTRISGLISIIIAIPLLLFSSEILLLFGKDYKLDERILQVLVVGQLVNTLSGPTGVLLNMAGKQVILRNISIAIFLTSIIFYYLFSNSIDVLNVAIIFSASIILQNIITVIYIYKKWKIVSFFH